jgi:hypothetical protein
MTQDEIIKLAKQAGCGPTLLNHWPFQLVAFANLVAAKEREACAEICDDQAGGAYWEGADACANRIRARGKA